ncbi:MAG: hypothetical protein AAGA23_09750 [Pseudomonadota bacterium]
MSQVHFQTHEPPTGGLSRLRRRLRQPAGPAPGARRYPAAIAAALLLVGVVLVTQIATGPAPPESAPLPDVSHPLLRAAGVAKAAGEVGEKTLMVRTGNVRAYWLTPTTPSAAEAR